MNISDVYHRMGLVVQPTNISMHRSRTYSTGNQELFGMARHLTAQSFNVVHLAVGYRSWGPIYSAMEAAHESG